MRCSSHVKFTASLFLSLFQALSTTILLQDGPFLCLRLGLIIHYKIISQSNVFFTTKNFLVVLLQLYRVCVIVIEHRKRAELARATDLHNTSNQFLKVPRKLPMKRKRRTGTILSASNGASPAPSPSMVAYRSPYSNVDGDEPNYDANSDPLPRRELSLGPNITPPPLPPPRSMGSHSKSLTTLVQPSTSVTNHKICTAV